MNLGGVEITALKLGNSQVDKVYLGSTEVWSSAPAILTDEISLGFSFVDGSGACSSFASAPVTRWIPQGELWFTASALYANSDGSTLASSGYYSDGATWRFWNGVAFTSDGICI